MNARDLMEHFCGAMDRLHLDYFITGSMASIAFGEPRFTNDIDAVVDLPISLVSQFCGEFPAPEFYCPESSARDAVRDRFQFNIIHSSSGLKIDVILPGKSDFDRSRFARTRRFQASDGNVLRFASPEDVIIKKLGYFQEGGSEKHIRDIIGVLKIQGSRIDQEYIETWIGRLGLQESWTELQDRMKS